MHLPNKFLREAITTFPTGISRKYFVVVEITQLQFTYNYFFRLAYGFRAHILNLGSYCLGLLPMTFLVINIKPGLAFNSTGIINETNNHSEMLDTKVFAIDFRISTF